MIIFTSICSNYFHKAMALASSVKAHIPDATFVVCLLDKQIPKVAVQFGPFDRIVLAKDMWEGPFDRFIFKHSIVEASTAVKARFFQFLYSEFPEEDQFIYLDPDIYVYSDFVELRAMLKTRPIVLCPHLLQPGNIDMELSSTAHGVYNLGFLAVNSSDEAKRLIDWWAERLYIFCFDDIQRGIFTDQKWMDLAPCFFDVEIFKHRGYDFATWSLLDCDMTERDGQVYVKGDPLRFIHFSGYGDTLNGCVAKWLPEGEHPFKRLLKEYSRVHDAFDAAKISHTPWPYDYYDSGEKVAVKIRQAYRENYEVMFEREDPFSMSNSYFKGCLGGMKKSRLVHYVLRMKQIVKEEGFRALCYRIIGRLR